MSSLKIVFAFTIAFICTISVFSQQNLDGLPFIKNYSPKEYKANSQNWSIVQDSSGILYIANNEGVLEYDGSDWHLHKLENNSSARALHWVKNNLIFVGGERTLGFMQHLKNGKLEYKSLVNKINSNQRDFNEVLSIVSNDDYVYFQSSKYIFRYSLKINKLLNPNEECKIYTAEKEFLTLFCINNKVLASEKLSGLVLLDTNNQIKIIGSENFADTSSFYSILPFEQNQFLGFTSKQGVWKCTFSLSMDAVKIEKFKTDFDNSLKNIKIKRGIFYNNQYYISSNSGILILRNDGKVTNKYDVECGLQSDVINDIFIQKEAAVDKQPVLWVASMNGLDGLEINTPLRYYNKLNGLDGVILDIKRYNQLLYLATNQGVFYIIENQISTETPSVFKKIQNLQNTCFSLLTFRYQTKQSTLDTLLLIGTDDGVFEIKQGKATKIINYKNVRKLFQPSHPSNQLMFGVKDGFFIYEYQNGKWIEKRHFTEINHDVFQIEQDLDSSIWLNGPYEVYNLKQEAQNWGSEIKKYGAENGLSVARRPYIYQLQSMGNKKGTCIYFATEEGLFFFDKSKQKFSLQKINDKNLKNIWEVREDNESNLWIRTYVNGKSHIHIIFKNQEQSIFDTVSFNRLPEISVYTIFPDNQYIVWFGGSNGLLRFYPSVVNSREYNFNVLIRNVEFNNSIKLGDISSLSGDYKKITIPFESNNVLFRYVAPFFIEEEKTLYSYFLEGEDEKWSDWQSKNEKEYTNLQEGNYVFHVKAKNLYEVESSITTFSFTISPPWYRTWWSYILYTVLSLTFIVIIVKLNSIRLIRKNEKLEQIIQERTLKVVLQKKEIEIQKGEIEIQKGEITDSINYASRIQTAILPFKEVLEKISSDFFVLWKPRDIVSGDFYWFKQIDNYTLIAAVDCTGHGVPGAFMSMLGTAFLNEIATNIEIKIRYQLEKNFEISAADILNQLREKVKQSLHQTGKDGEAKDGMDIALCIIDKTNNQLNFAGAHNPLYITREKNLPSIEGNKVVKAEFENCYLYQIKADSMPIGIFIKEQKFTDQYLKILTTDELFIFSDGFMDQIGGISNERFKSKRLKELFAKIRNKPMKEQKEFIEETFNDWVMYEKVLNQMDDILVIGIKI